MISGINPKTPKIIAPNPATIAVVPPATAIANAEIPVANKVTPAPTASIAIPNKANAPVKPSITGNNGPNTAPAIPRITNAPAKAAAAFPKLSQLTEPKIFTAAPRRINDVANPIIDKAVRPDESAACKAQVNPISSPKATVITVKLLPISSQLILANIFKAPPNITNDKANLIIPLVLSFKLVLCKAQVKPINSPKAKVMTVVALQISPQFIVDNIFKAPPNITSEKANLIIPFVLSFRLVLCKAQAKPINSPKATVITVKLLPISSQLNVANIFSAPPNIINEKANFVRPFTLPLLPLGKAHINPINSPIATVITVKLLPISSQLIVLIIFNATAKTKSDFANVLIAAVAVTIPFNFINFILEVSFINTANAPINSVNKTVIAPRPAARFSGLIIDNPIKANAKIPTALAIFISTSAFKFCWYSNKIPLTLFNALQIFLDEPDNPFINLFTPNKILEITPVLNTFITASRSPSLIDSPRIFPMLVVILLTKLNNPLKKDIPGPANSFILLIHFSRKPTILSMALPK